LLKEFLRKTIHICTALIPFLIKIAYWPAIIALGTVLGLYCLAELFRRQGHQIPLISSITRGAARRRDENRFVLGPVTLAAGVLLTALLFEPVPAAAGIYGLAFGDGLASLAGKVFGRIRNPFVRDKTVIGSHACFAAVFLSTCAVTHSAFTALCAACIGMVIENLPLRDFDNLLIPLCLAMFIQVYSQFHI
jgi:dolichol kinase